MARRSVGPWYRRGEETWYATVKGRKVSLRVRGRQNRAAAVAAWHRLAVEGPPEPATRVAAVLAAALSDAAMRVKPATLRLYQSHAEAFCAAFGTAAPGDVTPQDVQRWVASLPHCGTTKAMMLRSVSALFKDSPNPIAGVPKPKSRSRSRDAVIDAETYGRMLALASPAFRPLLETLYATGCRPGEACRVTAASFDAAALAIVLTDHKTDRDDRPRVIFVTPELRDVLRIAAERYPAGALFRTSRGRAWTPQLIYQQVRRLALRIGVKAMPYGFRHGFATRALSNGVPDAHVAALLGHTSTAVLHRHYSHLTSRADVLRESLGRVR